MFETPTFRDFEAQIGMQYGKACGELRLEIAQITAECARRGMLNSSGRVFKVQAAFAAALERTVAAILGELRRAIEATDLDRHQLRTAAHDGLERGFNGLVDAAGARKLQATVSSAGGSQMDDFLAQQRERLAFWIRQFDVGFDRPAEPEGGIVTRNEIRDSTIYGGVQQGSHGSKQNANVQIDTSAAMTAIRAIEAALASSSDAAVSDLSAEVDTIKAQLGKREPNRSILAEAARSLKAMVEGATGNLLASQIAPYLPPLIIAVSGGHAG